jgi:putative ABC transport system ATP-binding protein
VSAAEQAAPLLAVRGVHKSYRSGEEHVTVLRGLDLELPRGSLTSLMGVSGSGKSTLIAIVAGLLVADAGSVRFSGEDLGALDDTGRARLRAGRIGIVMQSGNLIPFLTAEENVQLAKDLAADGGEASGPEPHELLEQLGVGDRREHLPRRLSGGEAQRVSLAVALANAPELLLADEVVGAVDEATAAQVMDVIYSAGRERGLTVLFVTHSSELASDAERRLRLQNGVVVEV